MSDDSSKLGFQRETAEVIEGIVKAVPLYKDALQPGAKQAGRAVETLGMAVNAILEPLRRMCWNYEQIESYLVPTLNDKLRDVPAEELINPTSQIAGPAIEALRFVADEPAMRELFANLIASSMNKQTANNAHPAFVEIIKQLSSQEAQILQAFNWCKDIEMVKFRRQPEGAETSWVPLDGFYVTLDKLEFFRNKELLTATTNIRRMGLCVIGGRKDATTFFDARYAPQNLEVTDKYKHPWRMDVSGLLLTSFGLRFFDSCVKQADFTLVGNHSISDRESDYHVMHFA